MISFIAARARATATAAGVLALTACSAPSADLLPGIGDDGGPMTVVDIGGDERLAVQGDFDVGVCPQAAIDRLFAGASADSSCFTAAGRQSNRLRRAIESAFRDQGWRESRREETFTELSLDGQTRMVTVVPNTFSGNEADSSLFIIAQPR